VNSDTTTLLQRVFVLLFFAGYLRKSAKSDSGDAEPLHWPDNSKRVPWKCLHWRWQGRLLHIQQH